MALKATASALNFYWSALRKLISMKGLLLENLIGEQLFEA
jgi:hypothetical protein